MGTDTTEYRAPCPCGKGTILVTVSTPDHSWISAYNVHRSAHIECPVCDEQYVMDNMRVVLRAELQAYEAALAKLREAQKRFAALKVVRDIVADFGKRIDDLPSIAAAYRYLQEFQLTSCSIGTFRKRWTSGRDWAEQNVGHYNVQKILTLLGGQSKEIASQLEQLRNLEEAVPRVRTIQTLKS